MGAIVTVAALLLAAGAAWSLWRIWRRTHRSVADLRSDIWVITCPDTRRSAVLEITRSETGEVECEECSLWPEHLDCDTPCVAQVAADVEERRLVSGRA
jgi:hypothetical protein